MKLPSRSRGNVAQGKRSFAAGAGAVQTTMRVRMVVRPRVGFASTGMNQF